MRRYLNARCALIALTLITLEQAESVHCSDGTQSLACREILNNGRRFWGSEQP